MQGDDALILLLRFMATLKLGCAVGAAFLLVWRLRAGPIERARVAAYASAIALMAAGGAVIWQLDHIILGAALFHAGLLGALVIAWADRPALRAARPSHRRSLPGLPGVLRRS